jgi:hypothetical protein
MEFQDGMLFQASNFSDVASQWGISFTVWQPATTPSKSEKMELTLSLKEISSETFMVKQFGEKIAYSPDEPASVWVREELNGVEKELSPNMATGISVKSCGDKKIHKGSVGSMNSNSNNVYKNGTDVFIVSSCSSLNANISILPENLQKVSALFTARKSIAPNWVNCKDEYEAPETTHPDYEQWNNDALVYALFNNSSQQSSLRDIDYKGKKWDIKNHFFFMSNSEMLELANANSFNEMYRDAKRFPEDAYVYNLLEDTTLSEDAQDVLDAAKTLVNKSFGMRVAYHQDHPEYHLQTWDGGWAQLKPMMKEYFKADYALFVAQYKAFEDRMREGVYTFGFLRR